MLFSTLSMAEEACIFDDNAFNKDWINKRPALKKHYVWDADKREFGIVLNANTFINVSGGGCDHYGESYRMFVVNAAEIPRTTAWYKQQLLLLSKLVYNERQHKDFQQELSAVKIPLATIKSGEMFFYESSPSISINDKPSVVEFEISWFIN